MQNIDIIRMERDHAISTLEHTLIDFSRVSRLASVMGDRHMETQKAVEEIHEALSKGWISLSWKGYSRRRLLEKVLGPLKTTYAKEQTHETK